MTKRFDLADQNCKAVRTILDRVGDKWSIFIIVLLADGPRFNEIRRSVEGILQRMVTLTPGGLERDGLVKHTHFPTIPPRVEYELTAARAFLVEDCRAAWRMGADTCGSRLQSADDVRQEDWNLSVQSAVIKQKMCGFLLTLLRS